MEILHLPSNWTRATPSGPCATLHGGSGKRRMAALQLRPPEPFTFRNPDDWHRWRLRFEHFRVTFGLGTSEERQQVSTLLYCIGEEAEDVLGSTGTTEVERKDYQIVVCKFDSYFQVRQNVIYERVRFNRGTKKKVKPLKNTSRNSMLLPIIAIMER